MARSLTLAGLRRAGAKIKAPSLQTNCTKNEGPPKNMGFNGETV